MTEQRLLDKLVSAEGYGIFEPLTGYVAQITSDHAYIHKGIAYATAVNTTLLGNATKYLTITTPAGSSGYIHFRPTTVSTTASGVSVSFFEGATFTGGNTVTPRNHNRNVADTSIASVKADASVTVDGTLLFNFSVGSATRRSSGGSGGADDEILFKPNTDYCLKITNLTSTDTQIFNTFFWYEEENGFIA